MNKVLLIDGNNILYRSFFATAYNGIIMRNSKGFPTNALYGFIAMLNKIILEESPNYIFVALDTGHNFRHDKYEEYKAKREAMPDELKMQFPKAKEVLMAMGITVIECEPYEADDIIGTFAKKIELMENFIGTIISSDKDLLQLISDKVIVKLLKQSDSIYINKSEFKKIYGLDPIKMIDLKSLMGDQSDNIPGVKGIGEKTAISLLKEYKSLDGVYNNIDNIKGKVQEKLINDRKNAYMSYDLATIYQDVPLNISMNDIKYRGINQEKYVALLQEFEFQSLLKKINFKTNNTNEKKFEFKIINDINDFKITGNYAIYLELLNMNYHKGKRLGVAVYNSTEAYYIPFNVILQNKNLFDDKYDKYTYDLKKMLVSFKYLGIDINHCQYDAMIAAYLLNYNLNDDISYLANTLGYNIPLYEVEFGSDKKRNEPDTDVIAFNACLKAKFIYETRDKFLSELNDNKQNDLFFDIEMPLVNVLADMEFTGVKIDREYLKKMGEEFKQKINDISREIYDICGIEFNISSPKQLGKVLFEKLAIPYPKKIKNTAEAEYSTGKDILDKIMGINPVVEKILEYRTLTKLYNNYVVGLIDEIHEDGRVHTIFNQTLTRTGRLSSVSPNLQNIPIRLEYGRLIRKAFIPSDDSYLLSSDYSQIELRIFADMANATNLIDAFIEGKDIHTKTASDIFKVKECDVTKDMRRTAKTVNFGILYGISSFGLSEDLGINFNEAKKFINKYLDTYPGIKEYMDKSIKEAYEKGYVTTIMNRIRKIEELNNRNYIIRSQGERMALNTPIQGSSADILKLAMIKINDEFIKKNLKSKMIIQVHDELVFNVIKNELEIVKQIVKEIMENVYTLRVPLKVEMEVGTNWYEA